MKKRKTTDWFIAWHCILLAGISLLAGCGTWNAEPDQAWTPTNRPAGAVVSHRANEVQVARFHNHLELSGAGTQTLWGSYDRAFIQTVQQRWFELVDQESSIPTKGFVVLEFILNSDGHISRMQVKTNTANAQAAADCQKAVLDPAPYRAWPPEMQNTIGHNRRIAFTFYYEDSLKSVSKLQP